MSQPGVTGRKYKILKIMRLSSHFQKGKNSFHHRSLSSVCYGLDYKCPPQVVRLKAWSPACGTMGRKKNLWKAGPGGRKLPHWEYALQGDIGTLVSSSLMPWFPGHHKVNGLASHTVRHDVLSHPGSNWPWTKPLKSWANINLSCFRLIISSVCYSARNLTAYIA